MQRTVFTCGCLAITISACSDPLVASEAGPDSGSTPGVESTGSVEASSSTGNSSATSASATTGSTADATEADSEGSISSGNGAPSLCGDGIVEAEETCDDGNTQDGDACRADCQLAFELMDAQSLHFGEELASGVVVDDAGTAWITGWSRAVGRSEASPMLLSISPSGTLEAALNPSPSLDGGLHGISLHPSGDIVVAGSRDEGAGNDGLVRRLMLPSLDQAWEVVFDGPDGGSAAQDGDAAYDVDVDETGAVVVAYGSREVGEGLDVRVSKYDAAGALQWSWVHSGAAGQNDRLHEVAVAPNGDVVFGGVSNETLGVETGLLGRLSGDGELVALELSMPQPVFTVASDRDGGVLVAGDGWMEHRSALLDVVHFSDLDPGFDVAYGIAIHDEGFLVAGGTSVVGQQYDMFVGSWTLEGSPLWSDTHNNDASLNDVGLDVAVGPDGTVVVVGWETELGEGENVHVRRYRVLE